MGPRPDRRAPKRLDISFSVPYARCQVNADAHSRSATGHKQDQLVAFGVPRTASECYAPVMFVALLARDTLWPHGQHLFTQLFDCGLGGEIT